MTRLTETQQQLHAAARRFFERQGAATNLSPAQRRARWREIAELGWLGAPVREELGGFGGPREMAVLAQEIGLAAAPDPFLESGVFPAVFLAQARADLFETLISGEARVAAASVAPDSAAIRFAKKDGGYKLSGALRPVFGGEDADQFLIAASAEAAPHARAVFLLDAGAVKKQAIATIDGRTALALDVSGVALKAEAMIGEADEALAAYDYAHECALLAQCAELIGLMDRMFELTRDYLLVRKQFGQTLAGFQALRHRLADMFAELEQGRAMLDVGAAALEGASAARRAWALSACRLRIGKAARFVAAQAIQMHGAIAMTEEYGLGRFYKRALALRKIWGDEDFHARRMGAMRRKLATQPDEADALLFSSRAPIA